MSLKVHADCKQNCVDRDPAYTRMWRKIKLFLYQLMFTIGYIFWMVLHWVDKTRIEHLTNPEITLFWGPIASLQRVKARATQPWLYRAGVVIPLESTPQSHGNTNVLTKYRVSKRRIALKCQALTVNNKFMHVLNAHTLCWHRLPGTLRFRETAPPGTETGRASGVGSSRRQSNVRWLDPAIFSTCVTHGIAATWFGCCPGLWLIILRTVPSLVVWSGSTIKQPLRLERQNKQQTVAWEEKKSTIFFATIFFLHFFSTIFFIDNFFF